MTDETVKSRQKDSMPVERFGTASFADAGDEDNL